MPSFSLFWILSTARNVSEIRSWKEVNFIKLIPFSTPRGSSWIWVPTLAGRDSLEVLGLRWSRWPAKKGWPKGAPVFFSSPGPCQVAGAWKNRCFAIFTWHVLDLELVVGFQEILVFIQLWVRSVSCVLIQVYVEWESASTAHLTPFIKSSNFIQSSYQLAILLRNHVPYRKLT